jgi:hypothetical protein
MTKTMSRTQRFYKQLQRVTLKQKSWGGCSIISYCLDNIKGRVVKQQNLQLNVCLSIHFPLKDWRNWTKSIRIPTELSPRLGSNQSPIHLFQQKTQTKFLISLFLSKLKSSLMSLKNSAKKCKYPTP